jgi:lipopolysaccharide export system permease protein
MRIYSRYFYKELAKVFFLFLGCFYFLYVLIDYASHVKNLHQHGLPFSQVISYYFFQFSSMLEILIPAAFLVALIKVLLQVNLRNELVALLSSGLSYHRILAPFVLSSLVCGALLYCNFQFITPAASKRLDTFKSRFLKAGEEQNFEIGHLQLNDGTLLVYGAYDAAKGAFHDVFWVLNSDELYRIKTLYPREKTAKGLFVDHLVRDKNGDVRKKASHETLLFPKMKFEEKALYEAVNSPEWHSITGLLNSIPKQFTFEKVSDQEARSRTILFHKITVPLLSLLVCLAITPICLQFRRNLPVFIAFFMFISASKILGESQVISPLLALFSPYLICFTFFGYRYATL